MDDVPRLSYLIAVILVFFAAVFAVTETAISCVSKNKIKNSAEHGDKRAEKALYALDNFEKAITTILICTNIVHISAATVVTVAVTRQFGLSWVTLSTVITTIVVFFFGEMLPKSLAKKFAESFTLSNAGMLVFFMKFFSPLSNLLAKIGEKASKIIKAEPEISVTEDELHDIIEDMEEEGTLEEDESDLIQSAIEFGDTKVANIFTHRKDIKAIDASWSSNEIMTYIKNQTHSRIPVYEGNIDNIKGILNIRDYMRKFIEDPDNLNLDELLTKPLYIRRNYNIDDIMQVMAERRHTLAIVTSPEGKTTGIVTIEDILEELVGEIWDEDEIAGGAQ